MPEQPKPDLFLLTALPLVWSEQFGLDQPPAPAIRELGKHYTIKLIDLPSQLPERGLLLAAQPRALPAEELVALDVWVRRGGRLLLLADPVLEWPSERAPGDPLRPPMAYPDTGLLQHWGLRLDAPEQRGPKKGLWGGRYVSTVSPGMLTRLVGGCQVELGQLAARCSIGEGKATILADADVINGSDSASFAALASELGALSR